jgi:hypothetical protein
MVRSFIAASLIALAACGGGSKSGTTDAPVIQLADAPPPDAAPPDAFVCAAPSMMCGPDCLDTRTDEKACGSCTNACHAGESCQASQCACPAQSFIPATVTPSGFDPVQAQGTTTAAIGIITAGSAVDVLLVTYVNSDAATNATILGHDYDLATITPPNVPTIGAGYNVNIQTQSADATYIATAGKVNFTTACSIGASGTLTNVTFKGATISGGGLVIDPLGCTFTVATVNFTIGKACPPPI